METIKELLEILSKTPEMAIWALTLYFVFVLMKLASWIFALKIVLQQFIKRLFDYKEKSLNNKRGVDIAEMFEGCKIGGVEYSMLVELLNSIKSSGGYIHNSDIRDAIKKIKS